jgi:hypothetical protein
VNRYYAGRYFSLRDPLPATLPCAPLALKSIPRVISVSGIARLISQWAATERRADGASPTKPFRYAILPLSPVQASQVCGTKKLRINPRCCPCQRPWSRFRLQARIRWHHWHAYCYSVSWAHTSTHAPINSAHGILTTICDSRDLPSRLQYAIVPIRIRDEPRDHWQGCLPGRTYRQHPGLQ